MDSVTVLLASYNGQKYIKEQIDSILNQENATIKIIARDDSSSDNTLSILESYSSKLNDRFQILKDNKNVGAKNSFMELLRSTDDDYVMFSDQDDFWLSNKVEVSLKKMKELEKEYGIDTPLLAYCDMKVVDSELKTINESFIKSSKLNPYDTSLAKLLEQNKVSGCVMIMNKALVELSKRIPTGYFSMHDHWISLIATCFGHISYVDRSLSLYRQHGNNVLGAVKMSSLNYYIDGFKNAKKRHALAYDQARTLLDTYNDLLSNQDKEIIELFISLRKMNIFKKFYVMKKQSMFSGTMAIRFAQLLF